MYHSTQIRSPRARPLSQRPERPVVANRPSPNSKTAPTPTPRAPITQRPNGLPNSPPTTRPTVHQPPTWTNDPELKVMVRNMPPGLNTARIYKFWQQSGNVIKVEIKEPRSEDRTDVWIVFSPPPARLDWKAQATKLASAYREFTLSMHIEELPYRHFKHRSPMDMNRQFDEEIKVAAFSIDFGVFKAEESMLVLHTELASSAAPVEVVLNVRRKVLDVNFSVSTETPERTSRTEAARVTRKFKMRLNFAQLHQICQLKDDNGQIAWVISVESPPMMYRKADKAGDTHDGASLRWTEWQMWYRQTEIVNDPEHSRTALTQLQKDAAIIDIGRWLVYRLCFNSVTVATSNFKELCDALDPHNVTISDDRRIEFASADSQVMWSWLDSPANVLHETSGSALLSELHQLVHQTVNLSFELRYQLEACISHGLMHECNITKPFLHRLSEMDQERAIRLLEKVVDEQMHYYKPELIFRDVLPLVSIVRKARPSYCATIRTATVTPTTIQFNSPMVEPTNRVVRSFQQYEDRFLRVRFTEEKSKGKLWSSGDATMEEVFTRVKRTMMNGITIGGRHYEYLAFGNSQLRENGAWFFASTTNLTAQDIRNRMGDFAHIKVVAKHCSRIGQCFATTRATQVGVKVENIADIERNGFCFTDGVGKISPFLAQMIAQEYRLPNSSNDFPSVFQFRLGGRKGVLAVDPSLTGTVVQIRPSQEKFAAIQSRGLEICRISQFSTAYLNVQVILILSTLGVEDIVFLRKMRTMLADLKAAMFNQEKAVELLMKNVDFNRMTPQLAEMTYDGFMEVQEPFMISCLRLWRSWSIKYLKEKARILVEDGAFVLGCVDETGTLKGHLGLDIDEQDDRHDIASLSEIFLQVPDPACPGKWRVVQGTCSLARNPSLHPGDIRVVQAVDVSALHHLKNCVVFPQSGNRDLANMCSGGDLDGDDYLVMWDKQLMPKEWNHPPMNYTAPEPKMSEEAVTVNDMTSFFVTHMKYDNVALIATAHRYWADALPEGVKSQKCMELAQLHSTAVDHAKTGVPAQFPGRLRVSRWPHWAEVKGKSGGKIYKSNKVLGRLYDEVQRVPFEPAWRFPFDSRILEAYDLDGQVLEAARELKRAYDDSIRRLMARFSIKSEFEIWTTFVLEHSDGINDYKFQETIGEAVFALKEHHQKLCHEAAGADDATPDRHSKLRLFVTAMYKVTAEEMQDAVAECNRKKLVGGRFLPAKIPTVENMPFMSFPWLFPRVLGDVATGRDGRLMGDRPMLAVQKPRLKKKPDFDLLGGDDLPPLEDVTLPSEVYQGDGLLELSHEAKGVNGIASQNEVVDGRLLPEFNVPQSTGASLGTLLAFDHDGSMGSEKVDKPSGAAGCCSSAATELTVSSGPADMRVNGSLDTATGTNGLQSAEAVTADEDEENLGKKHGKGNSKEDEEEDEEEEEVSMTFDCQPSALDALERLLAL